MLDQKLYNIIREHLDLPKCFEVILLGKLDESDFLPHFYLKYQMGLMESAQQQYMQYAIFENVLNNIGNTIKNIFYSNITQKNIDKQPIYRNAFFILKNDLIFGNSEKYHDMFKEYYENYGTTYTEKPKYLPIMNTDKLYSLNGKILVYLKCEIESNNVLNMKISVDSHNYCKIEEI